MSLNDTVSAERLHIGFFGMRNAGKSSLANAVTGQSLSVVSDIKGTTTDPVRKAMELLPIGPVVILDTPGIDDEGELGSLRVEKAYEALSKTDIAVLVVDAAVGRSDEDDKLRETIKKRGIPFVTVYNKAELLGERRQLGDNEIYASAKEGFGIEELKALLGTLAKGTKPKRQLIGDLISESDTVVLVTPIDESAPKGRLILPQQMVLREVLDMHAVAIVCQDSELKNTLAALKNPPKLVICDSQVFGKVAKDVGEDIPLTSFSILMARYKGELPVLTEGFLALSMLREGDPVLISEGCTHHRQCNDIGTVKMPGWIKSFTGVTPEFHFTSGGDFPKDTSNYKLIVHCGGCMLNEAEMKSRILRAKDGGTPIVNYGIAIAGMNGILRRSLMPFADEYERIFGDTEDKK